MILQRYVLRQLLVGLVFAVGGLLFIALPGIAVSTVHRLPNADAVIMLRYIPLVLETLAPYVLPICFLLAVVATYGRLAADREWTAIHMAGIQPLKLVLPPLALALVLGAGTYWMVSTRGPLLKQRQRELVIDASTSSIANLGPGRTSLQIGEFLLEALWQDPETGLLHDVYIRKPSLEGEERIDYQAKTADLRVHDGVLLATLTDLYEVRLDEASEHTHQAWVQLELPLGRYLPAPGRTWRARYLTSPEIRSLLAAGSVEDRLLASYLFELHYRAVISTAFLLFVGLGVPTGLILRRGTQLVALAISSGFALVYYLLNMRIAKDLCFAGVMTPAACAWSPTILGAACALLLLRRAMRR